MFGTETNHYKKKYCTLQCLKKGKLCDNKNQKYKSFQTELAFYLVSVSIDDDVFAGDRVSDVAQLVDELEDLVGHALRLLLGIWKRERELWLKQDCKMT
jgi:hypothetical protein